MDPSTVEPYLDVERQQWQVTVESFRSNLTTTQWDAIAIVSELCGIPAQQLVDLAARQHHSPKPSTSAERTSCPNPSRDLGRIDTNGSTGPDDLSEPRLPPFTPLSPLQLVSPPSAWRPHLSNCPSARTEYMLCDSPGRTLLKGFLTTLDLKI